MRQVVFSLALAAFVLLSLACAGTDDNQHDNQNAQAALTGVRWQLETLTEAGETLRPEDPSAYTVEFEAGGRLVVQADCNRGMGSYLLSDDGLAVQVAFTRAFCPPPSLFDAFSLSLSRATSLSVEEGSLELTFDDGVMHFVVAEDETDAEGETVAPTDTGTGGAGIDTGSGGTGN